MTMIEQLAMAELQQLNFDAFAKGYTGPVVQPVEPAPVVDDFAPIPWDDNE